MSKSSEIYRPIASKKPYANAVVSYLSAGLYLVLAGALIACLVSLLKGAKTGIIISTVIALVVIAVLCVISQCFVWEIDPKLEKKSDGWWYSYRTAVGASMGKDMYKLHIYTITDFSVKNNKIVLSGDMDEYEGKVPHRVKQGVLFGKWDDSFVSSLKDCCYPRKEDGLDTSAEDDYNEVSSAELEKAEQSVRSIGEK